MPAKKTTERTKTGKNLLKKLFSRGYNRILFSLFIKRNEINRRILETDVARRRFGLDKTLFLSFCRSEIAIGPGTLNFIKRVFEHSVRNFFSIKKINGLFYFFIVDLPVKIFIYHFCALFRSDIRYKSAHKSSGTVTNRSSKNIPKS